MTDKYLVRDLFKDIVKPEGSMTFYFLEENNPTWEMRVRVYKGCFEPMSYDDYKNLIDLEVVYYTYRITSGTVCVTIKQKEDQNGSNV